jgi:predicted amino acid dehydrogenase
MSLTFTNAETTKSFYAKESIIFMDSLSATVGNYVLPLTNENPTIDSAKYTVYSVTTTNPVTQQILDDLAQFGTFIGNELNQFNIGIIGIYKIIITMTTPDLTQPPVLAVEIHIV